MNLNKSYIPMQCQFVGGMICHFVGSFGRSPLEFQPRGLYDESISYGKTRSCDA
ncbi:hypothetical protein KNP414_04961 [Paenibacillus mucilaginosus KNP414]|uniref:Uncharacterized protein n=1 Tax=Paenibacillus mucilaginosus (strain KNP414) TaxID=1036673 RepID=F8FLB8_PAEMK|nr:hypothetical protein KNP414_04961 [Paenibacillus mucilaginosus KNP414]